MSHLVPGHRLQLLEGSRAYFPALVEAMDAAHEEVRLETYIFDVTGAGAEVAEALLRTAARGVATYLVVDGVGTGPLPEAWAQRFTEAGVRWHVYAPPGPLGLLVPRHWRRLHRKLCVVDRRVAFCGGINILDDLHDPNHGVLEHPRLDFAVALQGPLVAQVHQVMTALWWRTQVLRRVRQHDLPAALQALRAATRPSPKPARAETAGARAMLLLRDNLRYRNRIEQAYLKAIGAARREVVIANAYFLPGGRLRRALVLAARRGVRVRLLLQGRYEYFMQYHASRPVYGQLLAAGVEIHEYAPSFLHAKVAVIDGHWATIGSSNLDPLSLLLAREANVVLDDPVFCAALLARLGQAMQAGQHIDPQAIARRPWHQRALDRVAFGLMRLALFLTGKRY